MAGLQTRAGLCTPRDAERWQHVDEPGASLALRRRTQPSATDADDGGSAGSRRVTGGQATSLLT